MPRTSLLWTSLAAVVFALTLSAASLAAITTTSPGSSFKLPVVIKDNGIEIGYNSSIPRGVIVTFVVTNDGKKTHNFAVLGRTTRALKPGAHGQFTIDLQHRGAFRFKSTYGNDSKNKRLSGFFTVY